MDDEQKRGKRHEIKIRYAWNRAALRRQRRQVVTSRNARMAAIRASELNRLFLERYGPQLPDDDAGAADLDLMLHHLAHLRNPEPKMREAIGRLAPWLLCGRAMALIDRAIAQPHAWTADELGKRLNLTSAERLDLAITTIGAVDMPKEQRATRRRKLKRLREAKRRRANGAKRRIEYEKAANTTQKPWIAMGISRRTWYRRHRGTGPCPA